MASYQGHLTVAGLLGVGYAALGVWPLGLDWGPVVLGAGLTTLGGLLPDLDSDSGVPVRELFGLAAAVVPILIFARVQQFGLTIEQTIAVLAVVYVLIRYGLRALFNRITVHRGMFHSIPAMLIAGLIVFLLDHNPGSDRQSNLIVRSYLAGGVMLGFLSHLVLDEIYSINFMGFRVRLNKYAGSAVKLFSPSLPATLAAYTLLVILAGLAWLDLSRAPQASP
jgi:LexA-binding, inner membrane-associated putative hydrolase